MRRDVTSLAVLLAAALTLVGCGSRTVSGSPSAAESAASAPTSRAATSEAARVEQVFREYNQALLARDFPKACAYNAPETIEKLLENVRSQNLAAADCPEAFQKIYATPGAAALLDEVTRTARVRGVNVDGDNATITWSTESSGTTQTVSHRMRKIDGEWKLVDVD